MCKCNYSFLLYLFRVVKYFVLKKQMQRDTNLFIDFDCYKNLNYLSIDLFDYEIGTNQCKIYEVIDKLHRYFFKRIETEIITVLMIIAVVPFIIIVIDVMIVWFMVRTFVLFHHYEIHRLNWIGAIICVPLLCLMYITFLSQLLTTTSYFSSG